MSTAVNDGVRISYERSGSGPILILLHGWCCDRSWWIEPGFVADLERDYSIVNVDLRGHGASDKPHEVAAYRADRWVGDVLAVADLEGAERFAIWGQSYGGWVGWVTAAAAPQRVTGLISSGEWDPRPSEYDEDWQAFDNSWLAALRRGGTPALIEVFREEEGDRFNEEFPPWAQAVTLQADPAALLASQSRDLLGEGVADLEGFPVPALLISGGREDPENEAASIAKRLPRGESLHLPGLGHAATCRASHLTLTPARDFLARVSM